MPKSQRKRVLKHLKKFGTINPHEALHRYGVFRLGARIFELRQQGHDIETEIVRIGSSKVAQYRLGLGRQERLPLSGGKR